MGHKEREDRANKILKLATKSKETPDENCRVWIKKGPVSVETSLKELEDNYERQKVIVLYTSLMPFFPGEN